MGKFNPTPQQKRVIDERGRNILVSAAAGSGKTAVLTGRIIARILDKEHPVSIDRLLIVTFTEAAAAEMRKRISEAITEKLREFPDNEELRKQKTLVHSALIMTVHGFCLYLIRNHFDSIGLDPSFRVATEEETRLLMEDVAEEILSDLMQTDEKKYADLEEHFARGFLDNKCKDLIKDIHYTAMAQPFPEDWYDDMERKLDAFIEDPEHTPLISYGMDYEDKILKDCLGDLKTAISLAGQEGGPAKYLPALLDDEAFVEALTDANNLRRRTVLFRTHEFPNIGREASSELKEIVKGLRDSVKDTLDKLNKKFHNLDFDTAISDDTKTASLLKELLSLARELSLRFAEKKKERGFIDFSDMEHFALEILLRKENGERIPSDVAKSYRAFFDEVMVDEYQDSNAIQESLLNAVSKDDPTVGNRFMVGDVKQSIYRFRLAEPEIFREKYDTYPTEEAGKNIRLDLSSNFRSRTEVLDAVNCVFEDSMHTSVGEIEYDESARLYYGATSYGGPKEDAKAELLVLPEENWKETGIRNKTAWEALAVGKRIKELLDSDYQVLDHFEEDKAVLRKVRFSDIMILVRKVKNRAAQIKSALDEMGIPTMVISKEGYFMAPEVILVLNLISVINNPRQDIPLIGVLHSFLGGFEEADFAEIRGINKNELFYDSMMRYRKMGTDRKIIDKIKAFDEKLNAYRSLADRESVYDLLLTVFEREGIMEHFRLLRLGEQRVANLRILLQKAEEFAATGFVGLSEFVRYIENVKNREIDFGEANILDENANVVRIYTMHKSKGLEFPVCFILGCGEKLSTKLDSKEVPTDKKLGMAADYTDPVARIKRKSLSRAILLSKDALERRGEDLRLLYVAMTRAREKLIMVGTAPKKLLEADGSFGKKRSFTTSEILGAASYISLLFPEAQRNPDCFDIGYCTVEQTEEAKLTDALDTVKLKNDLKAVSAAREPFVPYTYPHESLGNVFTKTTVSDLKKAAYMEENEGADELFRDAEGYKEDGGEEYVPAFMRPEEKKISGSLYGTAHHRVMELLNLGAFTEEEMAAGSNSASLMAKLNEQRAALVDSYALPSEENKLVRNESVAAFLADGVAKRMRTAEEAGKLYREQPFVLSLPANEVGEELPPTEHVLLQGVIDVYFEEDGELVLLDYKTDSKVDEEELIKRYRAQLKYYAKALEKLEKKKVKEVLIYSFFLGKTIELTN